MPISTCEEFKFRGRYDAAFVFANGTLSATLNEFTGIRKAFDESPAAGIRNLASGIRNFEIWNPASYGIRNPPTYEIRNPRTWNPESKTFLDYLPYIGRLLAETKRHVIPATKCKFIPEHRRFNQKQHQTSKQKKTKTNKTKQKLRFFYSMSLKDSFGLKKNPISRNPERKCYIG